MNLENVKNYIKSRIEELINNPDDPLMENPLCLSMYQILLEAYETFIIDEKCDELMDRFMTCEILDRIVKENIDNYNSFDLKEELSMDPGETTARSVSTFYNGLIFDELETLKLEFEKELIIEQDIKNSLYIVIVNPAFIRDTQRYSGGDPYIFEEDIQNRDDWIDFQPNHFVGIYKAKSQKEALEIASNNSEFPFFILEAQRLDVSK